MAQLLNYATEYSQALDQMFPYVLNFGALYATPNNGRYRWEGAKTIQIPTIRTTGRTDADRDTIGVATRNYDNAWQPKVLENFRMWTTLVHPMDIDETNYTASIANITQTYNNEQKFPEMDAYTVSKLYADWKALGRTAKTDAITTDNVLMLFDNMMTEMTDRRVPSTGRVLYLTPQAYESLRRAKEISRQVDIKDGGTAWNTLVNSIDKVQLAEVSSELMKTVYDFTVGWAPGVGAKQIHMLLVHPMAVITPVKYNFARLDQPSAMSQGKWVYYEESYEDVFILDNKADAINFVLAS